MPHDLFVTLRNALSGDAAALAVNAILQPVNPAQDQVMPPTYLSDDPKNKSTYAFMSRRVNGELHQTVLLDSIASQANRLELALLAATRADDVPLPDMVVDIAGYGGVSVYEMPHRVYDAILRDSQLDGVPFRETAIGRRLYAARPLSARPLYERCPAVPLFGGWHSHAGSGGRGAKFQRALQSEIIGLDPEATVRVGSRIDPLNIQRNAAVLYKAADPAQVWTLDEAQAARDDRNKPILVGSDKQRGHPSAVGHSNIPPALVTMTGGVSIREARQLSTLSFPALRRLSFADPETGEHDPVWDETGRTVLALLGLYAVLRLLETPCNLRSGCDLALAADPQVLLVGRRVDQAQPLTVSAAAVGAALGVAIEVAAGQGLTLFSEPLRLRANPQLEQLYRASCQSSAEDGEDAGEGAVDAGA